MSQVFKSFRFAHKSDVAPHFHQVIYIIKVALKLSDTQFLLWITHQKVIVHCL